MTSSLSDTYYYKEFDLKNLPVPIKPPTTSTTNILTTQTLLTNIIYDVSNKQIGLANLICYLTYNKNTISYRYAIEINLNIDDIKLDYSYYLDFQLLSNNDKSTSLTPSKYNLSIGNNPIDNIKSSVYKLYNDRSNNYIIEAFYITY